MVILARRKASWRVRPATWARFDKKQPRWPQGTPHVGDIGPGRWMELGDIIALLKNKEASDEDKRAVLGKLTKAQLVKVADEAGRPITKTALKAHVIDEVVAGRKKASAKVAKKAPTKKARPVAKGGSDESLRPDGDGALAEVPPDRVRPDGGSAGVLHGSGDTARPGDSDAGGRPGGVGATGRDVPGPGREDEDGTGSGEGAGSPGDAAAGRGGRGDDAGSGAGDAAARGRTVDGAPVFRPQGQQDLAPDTATKRLEANLAALRTLRQIQSEQRPATADEQRILARYSGWGSLKDVFKPKPPTRRLAEAQAEMRELLSVDEFADARRSVQYAHYTDASIVQSVWRAMQDLGFRGGRVLEPGSGTGNFMGFAPEDTNMVGVEVEPVTAAIAKALYPNANVWNESFADTLVHDGDFDAAVGNVPFSSVRLLDKTHNPGGKLAMHNHFIVKSLRGVRPGGLVAVLTSRYTMDATGLTARREMAKLGDLVGAVRLPSGAHRKAAGTDVVTDLLIFRRREPGAKPAGLPFVHTKPVDVDGVTVAVNEAFADNPELVLGEFGLGGMRHREDLTVAADPEGVPGALTKALDRIATRARADGLTMTERQGPIEPLPDAGGRSTRQPDGFTRALPDGTFTRVTNGVEQPYSVPSAQADELRALLDLRDNLDRLLEAEAGSEQATPEMAQLRSRLNRAYDDYTKRFGFINRFTAVTTNRKDSETGEPVVLRRYPDQGGFNDDPSAAAVKALEHYDPAQNTGRKADIFSKRVVAPRAPKTSADTAEEALAIALDQHGRVDLDRVARLLGKDRDTARGMLAGLVFADPSNDGELIPRAEYLSGDVREKLGVAKRAAALDKAYEENVAALERIQPPDLKPDEIHAQLGATWIGRKHVEDFLREILNDKSIRVEHPHGNEWTVKYDRRSDAVEATSQWGTPDFPAPEIAERLLTMRPIKVYDVSTGVRPDGSTYEVKRLNRSKTEAAQAKAQEMNERFAEWVWQDPDRADELAEAYNRMFNSLVLRGYEEEGKRLTLPGMSVLFKPHDHVKAAVARVVSEPSVGLWHEVGAGKTAEMVISAMELRRLGLVNKPAIVVPNHMLEQFRDEFIEIYPQAHVLAASSADLTGEGRRKFIAKAATGEWDAVILTQGAFERIPVSADTQKIYLRKELNEFDLAIKDARGALETETLDDAAKKRAQKTIAQMESAKERTEQRIKANIEKVARDPGLTFEKTGIDYLFIDEAHHYKNLRRISRVEGMSHPGNGKTTDLATKIDYLRRKYTPDVRKLSEEISTNESDWTNGLKKAKWTRGDYIADAQYTLDSGVPKREVADQLAAEAGALRQHADDSDWQERHRTDEEGMLAKADRLERLADRLRGAKSGRIITLATATPIANSVGEAHTMMRYLRPDLLESMKIDNFDHFVANFAQVLTNVEPAPEGGMRLKTRLSKFLNVPELQRAWWIAGDVKTDRDLFGEPGSQRRKDLLIPELRGGKPEVEVVPASEELKAKIAELGERAKAIRSRRGKPEPGQDIMLNITSEGRAAALDLRMVGRETDEVSKLDVAADRIHEIWRQSKGNRYRTNPKDPNSPLHPTPGALQIVFADIGTPKTATAKERKAALKQAKAQSAEEGDFVSTLTDFDAYEDLRSKLVERGIPREQIRFIHEAKSDKDKQKLFADARDGRVAVLVGSTGKMGTGTNVQNRAIALHHLDVPWRPADVQQREGRIIRQKNQNPEVRVIRYVTEGSFDSYNWGVIARKAGFINQMMSGRKSDVREIEDVGDSELSASEAMALAAGRPELIEFARVQAELARLERLQRSHDSNLRNLRARITASERRIKDSQQLMGELDKAIERRDTNTPDKFHMTVVSPQFGQGPREYDSRAAANEALRGHIRQANLFRSRRIGSVNGFDVYTELIPNASGTRVDYRVDLRDPTNDDAVVPGSELTLSRAEVDAGDIVTKLTNKLRGLETLRARHEQVVADQRDRIEKATAALREPFRYEDDLNVTRSKFQELDEAIREEAAEAAEKADMQGAEGDAARALLAFLGDESRPSPTNVAAIEARLERGGGFESLDEVRTYLNSDSPNISYPSEAARTFVDRYKARLTPSGRLLVHKAIKGTGYNVTEPRTMRSFGRTGQARTAQEAMELAMLYEGIGFPWNADMANPERLREWRAPNGDTLPQALARARASRPELDPDGEFAEQVREIDAKRRELVGARSALAAALLVDTVTGGRYTPQQRQARDVWLRSALVRFDPNQPRDPHTGEWIDVTPGSAVIKGFTAWLKKTYGKVGKPRIATDKKGVHVTFDYKDSPVTVDLTYLDLASFALGAAGGGVGAVAKSAHVAGKVNKAVKLAKAAKAAKVAASGAGLVASVAPRSWNTVSRFERVAGKDTHPGGEQLKHYWTKDPEGLAKWATRPSGRWTALYNHLKKHMAPEMAKRVAAEWFHDVFKYWPGSDVNRVASGKPPRGKKIGPG